MNKINEIAQQFLYFSQSDKKQFEIAQELIDRLLISNCFSTAEITNFIKNELSSLLFLFDEEVEKLLEEYKLKLTMISDKIKISKMKQILFKIKVEDNKITEMTKKIGIEQISKNLVESNFISNNKLLFNFIVMDLCLHFNLSKEERKEIAREVKQWMLKN